MTVVAPSLYQHCYKTTKINVKSLKDPGQCELVQVSKTLPCTGQITAFAVDFFHMCGWWHQGELAASSPTH